MSIPRTLRLNDYLKKQSYDKLQHPMITNTRIANPEDGIYGGAYYISDEEYPEFLKRYYEQVVKKGKLEYLTEKQLEKSAPILVDLDFRFGTDITERQYTSAHITELIDAYLNTLKTMYQFDEETKFEIIVLEKPRVNCLPDKTKDGLHLIITLQSDRNTQKLLREKMLDSVTEIFSNIPLKNEAKDILDEGISVGHCNWQLFGSCKPNHDTYVMTQLLEVGFDPADGEFTINDIDVKNYSLEENFHKLSARTVPQCCAFFSSKFSDEHKTYTESLKKPEIKNTVVTNVVSKNAKKDEILIRKIIASGIVTSRASGTKWTDFGWMLKNEFDDTIGWDLFDTFSKLDMKDYDLSENRKKWDSWKVIPDSGEKNRKCIKWLVTALKKSHKDEIKEIYDEMKQETKEFTPISSLELEAYFALIDEWNDKLSSKKLAVRFLEKFGDYVLKYKFRIYVYYGNKWYDETDSKRQYKLTRYISENLYDTLEEDISADTVLKPKDKRALLKTLRSNTSNGSRIHDIIVHMLSDAKESKVDFDTKPFLIGFDNGVYDLQADEFREYKFDDYMTLTTKYDYIAPDYNIESNQKIREELAKLIESIQPNPENRILYLQTLASGLDGRAYQKLFLFNGQGGNGKGLTGSLMDIVLGDYYHQPGNGILKDVEKANTPSPDMINLKNKRYINFKEVQGLIKVSVSRNLTGGGKFVGRYLNQNPEEFYLSSTTVMEFNCPPELDGKPMASDYRRIVDEEFPVNFTDDETKIGKIIGGILYQKANHYYETQEFLQKTKLIFLDLLLGVYRQYKNRDNVTGIEFIIPESVKERTRIFLENQNLFQKIFNDIWVKSEIGLDEDGKENKIDKKNKTQKLKTIWDSITYHDEYKRLNYRDKRQYSRDEFHKWIETVANVSGDSKGKVVIGVIRKEDDGDDDDSDNEQDENNTVVTESF